ncbi:hypothetical protein HRG_001988 [Hirsutella rhossiliensis]|uniref:Uncharacterized protein n=1 Tax=Hirsutella rhossiliensis TaxID=111463 RepID=A0A9P8N4C3_9HYPO|nr:uncharacterized protein HRG_01988 [Hirsutella rhossiliensis]KAH0966579.1 hypothetical protein HRG_01988 [Hirsutella rhossiliensis]
MVRIAAAAALLAFAASALAGNQGQAANNAVNQAQGGAAGAAGNANGNGATAGAGGTASKTPAVDARIKELTDLQKKKEQDAVQAEASGNQGLADALRTQKNGAIAQQLTNLQQAQKAAN